jgi:voltage-gated potassium channel Kch
VLVVEKNADNRFLPAIRERGIPVMIADATVPGTLVDAAVDRAAAVASIVGDDLVNLEVGLNARAIHPRIRVILRIFDGDTAEELRRRPQHPLRDQHIGDRGAGDARARRSPGLECGQ